MADDKIGLFLEVQLENAESVEHLRDVIKSATDAALMFGEGTKEFDKFTSIAAKAKDELGDLRQRITALDPGAKAQAFQALGNTIVGGFQAGVAAMSVFTGDNEELNRILLKSMALVQGLQGIQAIADAKKHAGAVLAIFGINAQIAATVTLKSVTQALMGPIGLVIAAVTAVATVAVAMIRSLGNSEAGFRKAAQEAANYANKIRELNEYTKGLADEEVRRLELSGASDEAVYAAKLKAAQDFRVKSEAEQQKIIESNRNLQGKTSDAKFNLRQIKEEDRELFEANKKRYFELNKIILAAQNEELAITKDFQDKKDKAAEEEAKKRQDDAKKIADENQRLADEKKKIRDDFEAQAKKARQTDLQNELDDLSKKTQAYIKAGGDRATALEAQFQQEQEIKKKYNELDRQALEKIRQENEQLEQLKQQKAQELSEKLKGIGDEIRAQQEEEKLKAIEIENEKWRLRFEIAQGFTNSIASLGTILTNDAKKQQGFAKVAAGLQIVIDSAKGVSAAVAAGAGVPFPLNLGAIASGVAAVLAGIANAKKLLSKAGGSAPDTGVGGGNGILDNLRSAPNTQAPDLNQGQQRTLLDDAARRRARGGQNILEATVVIGELTDAQREEAVAHSRAKRRVR